MRICIVGGIFDKPAAYQSKHSISPETVLAAGLRERGVDVVVSGHHQHLPQGTFDIIHVHHFGRMALRVAAAKRPAFVFTTHDPFSMNGLPVGWRRRLTDGFVLAQTDAVVALSNAECNFLMRRYGLPPSRIAVIPNGIDTRVFDRAQETVAGGEEQLLFVGQLREFKGLPYLLEALPAVRITHPQAKLRIVYQTDVLLDQYQLLAERLGLDSMVEFAGPKTAVELAELYSTAAVVVVPSLGECLSTVVLEAMTCGAAVVATDVGGIREQLDETTGVVVPPRDPVALANAVCRLLAKPDLRRAMGPAARRKARAQFSVRHMIDRHLRLYEQLLGADECAA
jgi:glycosyltransferase involved in cell wall biosynthesis